MIHGPLVSVVIPTYNRAGQVTAAVESVLAQSYSEVEIIVVDDGSSDGTAQAVQRLIEEQGSNGMHIRSFAQANQGASAARNRAIAEAHGEWIAFLDSDDVWLPEKLEWQVRALGQFESVCGACITDAELVNVSGINTTAFRMAGKHYRETIGIAPDAVKRLVRSFDHFWVSTLLARADLVRQIGGFDPNIVFAEDHDFNFRLALVTCFSYVNKPLVLIDRSPSPPGSTCRPWDKAEVRLRAQQSMFEKWLTLDGQLPARARKSVVRNLREVHSAWANWYLENERYDEARRAVSRAVKYELTPRLVVKWALTRAVPTLARRICAARRRRIQ